MVHNQTCLKKNTPNKINSNQINLDNHHNLIFPQNHNQIILKNKKNIHKNIKIKCCITVQIN